MTERGGKELGQQEQKPKRVQISTVEKYLEEIRKIPSGDYIYRGQSNSAWPVDASATRRIKTRTPVFIERLLLSYSVEMVNEVKMRFALDVKDLSDLEIMAKIQHFRGATGLIDFTADPLAALWFACFENKGEDGAIYMLNITEDIEMIKNYDMVQKKPVEGFFGKEKTWAWRPPNIETRIVSQDSWFVFGKATILPYQFTKILTVEKKHKMPILDALSKLNVTEENLFNDFHGFAEINGSSRKYDHQRLLEYYNEVIKSNPKDAEAYFNRGNAKAALGNYQAAIPDYDEAIELDSQLVIAYYNRGLSKSILENYQDAIADYDETIKLNPQYVDAYHYRGFTKACSGNYQDAIADYDEAIKLNPQYAKAYYSRGLAKKESGDEAGAEKDFARAKELDPSLGNTGE